MEKEDKLLPSQSTQEPAVPKGRRRGKVSRQKAAEKFRSLKNDTIGVDYIGKRVQRFQLDHGYHSDQIFGSLALNIPTSRPYQKVTVATHQLKVLARLTVQTLHNACKVPVHQFGVDYDIRTVQFAASLQLFSKFYYASQNTPYAIVSSELEALSERVVRNLNVGILPIAIFIDQIGKVSFDNQNFVGVDVDPTQEGPYFSSSYLMLRDHANNVFESAELGLGVNLFTAHGEQILTTDIRCGDSPVFVRVLNRELAIGNRVIAVDGQNIQLNYDLVFNTPDDQQEHLGFRRLFSAHQAANIPAVDEIFQRYIEFLARAQKKVAFEKFPSLELASGRGTVAQLVAVGPEILDTRSVWSTRLVGPSEMFMSGALQLGILYEDQAILAESAASVTAMVDVRSGLQMLVKVLSQRLER